MIFTPSGIKILTRLATANDPSIDEYIDNGTPEQTKQLGCFLPLDRHDRIFYTDEHIKLELTLPPHVARSIRSLRLLIYGSNRGTIEAWASPLSRFKRRWRKLCAPARLLSPRIPVEFNLGPLLKHLMMCDIFGRQTYGSSSLKMRKEFSKAGIMLEDVVLSTGERWLAGGWKMDRWRCKPSMLRTMATVKSDEENEN